MGAICLAAPFAAHAQSGHGVLNGYLDQVDLEDTYNHPFSLTMTDVPYSFVNISVFALVPATSLTDPGCGTNFSIQGQRGVGGTSDPVFLPAGQNTATFTFSTPFTPGEQVKLVAAAVGTCDTPAAKINVTAVYTY